MAMALRAGLMAGIAAAGIGLAMPVPAIAQPSAPPLAPHRAIYDITLDKSRGGTGVAEVTGRMVYELTGSTCEGYTQSMRFVTRMTSQDGTPTLSDLRSSSWEEWGAKKFRFSSSQYKDEKLGDQVSGDAERDDKDIVVQLTRPKKGEQKLAGAALFPIQHSLALLDAARAGKSMFTTDLYDGSEKGDKVFATTAVIGKRLAPGFNKTLKSVGKAEKLDALPAWPISLSYFEKGQDKQDALPTYELGFVFFDNGVSRRLFIDYGEFSIKGQLQDLTFLDETKCERKP